MSLFKGPPQSPYGRRTDVESGSSNSGDVDDDDSSNPFEIRTTKHASVDRLRRWRVRFFFFFNVLLSILLIFYSFCFFPHNFL